MDPDEVIGFDDLFEFGRKMFVRPHVSGEIAPRELGEIEPEMQNRPQHPVGEAVVVFLIVLLGEVGDHIGDVLVVHRVHLDIRARHSLAAPAEPHAPVALQGRPQCNFEAAGTFGAVSTGDTNPI